MNRHTFILILLIAVFLGFSAQQTFAQPPTKTTKIGNKGKMIEIQPKQLFVEVTVKGDGTCDNSDRGKEPTCTWKIDRKYTATIDLSGYEKRPYEQKDVEPGTASAIAQANVRAKIKENPAAAFNTHWFYKTVGGFDVSVSINDELKETWKVEKQGGGVKEKFTTTTWTANTKGRSSGAGIAYVILDRSKKAFDLVAELRSDAQMDMKIIGSDEDTLVLPAPVWDVPEITGRVESLVNIKFDGGIPDETTASFEKTFPNLKSEFLLGALEIKEPTITVKYKFGNKGEN